MARANASKIIAYYRVSTDRQGKSGLGLEAQQQAVKAHAAASGAKIVASFTEVESGRKNDRQELRRALAACHRRKATLAIAKLDRLARNVAFVSNLMESGVPFVACDNPHATPLTIHIRAAVAEDEAKRISERTKAALAAAKAKGVKLGTDNMTPTIRCQGTAANVTAAADHAAKARPMAERLRAAGTTLAAIADSLTESGLLTRRGKAWTATSIHRLLAS